MYKSRFKVWGLSKNLTACDIPSLSHVLATRETSDNASEVVIRGQKIPLTRAKLYMHRKKGPATTVNNRNKAVQRRQRRRTVEPLPPRMEPPDDLRLTETIIQISSQFIAGGTSTIWFPDATNFKYSSSVSVIDWMDDMHSVMHFFGQTRYKEAFSLLSTCFDRFKLLLVEPSPSLFNQLYYIIIWLPSDIGQRLLAYVAQMTTIALPARHPLRLAWTRLHQAGLQKTVDIAWLVLSSHMSSFGAWFQDCMVEVVDIYNPTDVESTVPWQTRKTKRLQAADYLPRCQLLLTWVLYRSKNYGQVSLFLRLDAPSLPPNP